MSYRSILAAILLTFSLAAAGHAQRSLQYSAGFGSQVGPVLSDFHARASATVATSLPVQLRLDGLLAQRRPGDEHITSLTANLVTRLSIHRLVPYAVAGAGVNTTGYLLKTVGLGWALPAQVGMGSRTLPLSVEWRGYWTHHKQSFTVGLGARF